MINENDPWPQDDPSLPPLSAKINQGINLVAAALVIAFIVAVIALYRGIPT